MKEEGGSERTNQKYLVLVVCILAVMITYAFGSSIYQHHRWKRVMQEMETRDAYRTLLWSAESSVEEVENELVSVDRAVRVLAEHLNQLSKEEQVDFLAKTRRDMMQRLPEDTRPPVADKVWQTFLDRLSAYGYQSQ